ncbi:hypothetical protein K1T71_010087 [Dendrolimus kikuchii]|uniref:Uncharacterized protein n=1 Tax=Dendrolimus kikuchii TaxID=765133 RepID=A0ACC1CQN4_9NEOP|nr:hypothetical protein K1T71_010087 [Dendrolimus kikuchii]
MAASIIFLILLLQQGMCLLPPKFQWKVIDYKWESNAAKQKAIQAGDYIPENNMPTGVARWRDKLFITIPRWKDGVPSSLNYVSLNGTQQEALNPYPNWAEAYVPSKTCCLHSKRTVVSTFRVFIDGYDRLWVVDNGVLDMTDEAKRIAPASLMIFDLNTDELILRHEFSNDVVQDSSVLTSVVADISSKGCSCDNSYAYIADMGSNALIVYSLKNDEAWRIDHDSLNFDPEDGDDGGMLSIALGPVKGDGSCDLYMQLPSSTNLYKISTKLLRDKNIPKDQIKNGLQVVGDRGPLSQGTACDFDPATKVLFNTQLSRNGIGCWHVDKPFNEENTPVIISDCNMLEFPNDIKVDHDGDIWILSDRQSKFLYGSMDFTQMNFKVLTAPVADVIMDTPCEKKSGFNKAFGFMKRPKSGRSTTSSKNSSARSDKRSKN